MKVAFITPTAHLHTHGNFSDYHMILPEQLGTFTDNEYYTFYKSLANGYKILDNGAAEGNQLHPVDLIQLAFEMQVDEIVVPDEMGDARVTMLKAMEFKHIARRHPTRFKYMAVLQGRTLAQIDECLNMYLTESWIDTIAFPRCLQEYWHPYVRAEFIFYAQKRTRQYKKGIHCLGATVYPYEVWKLARLGVVRGIDTCVPAEFARRGIEMEIDQVYKGRLPEFFRWHAARTEDEWLLNKNYQTYLEWATYEGKPIRDLDMSRESTQTPSASTVLGTPDLGSPTLPVHRPQTPSS